QRANRALGCALAAKQLALNRLENAFEHLPALGGFGICHPDACDVEHFLRVPRGVTVADAERRLGDEAEPAPLEVRPELKDLGHRRESGAVAFPRDHASVLVLDDRSSFLELAQQ